MELSGIEMFVSWSLHLQQNIINVIDTNTESRS